jgi:PKD repeat protein
VSFSFPQRVPPEAARPLSASAYDPGQDALAYHWDFGDGSTGDGPEVIHSWQTPGTYTVTVTVDDGDGGVGTSRAYFDVAAAKADAGADVTIDEGGTATLGGPASSPADSFTSFRWDFGDDLTGAGAAMVNHSYLDEGSYSAKLTVADDASSDTDDAVVTVRNVPPDIGGIAAPVETVRATPASFKVFATDPGPKDVLSVRWDFGDGSAGTGAAIDHAFATAGMYTVKVTVSDEDGGETSASRQVKVVAALAGVPDSYGRDFWLDFDSNAYADSTSALTLFITGPHATQGVVEAPGAGIRIPFSVTADEITAVGLPTSLMLGNAATSGTIEPRAIHVAADDDVVVYGLNRTMYTTDAYLGQPIDTTGTRYRVMSYGAGYGGSLFSVVATRNDTTITVTPAAALPDHPADEPFTVSLDIGEAVQFQAHNGKDLTGTLLTSNKPVSVFGGHQCANVPANVPYCDHIVEQLAPPSRWGRHFVTAPLSGRKGDTFRVLADVADTHVTITSSEGDEHVTLGAGEFHEMLVGVPLSIDSDQPISLAQFSNGSTFDQTVSDPFMVLVPPAEQYFTSYVVATPAQGFRSNFLNITVPTAAAGGVKVDGNSVPDDTFKAIPGSTYSAASVPVEPGTHRLTADAPFGVTVYGFDADDSYGYSGGSGGGAVATVAAVRLTPSEQKAVVGGQACMTISVLDSSDSRLPGIRVDVTVAGASESRQSVVTGTDGTVPFCYSATSDGTDTITATAAGAHDTSKVIWTTPGTNQPPTAEPRSLALDEDTSASLKLTGRDPEESSLTFRVTSMPSHGALTGTAPNLTYIPNPTYNGEDSIEFVVSDGRLTSAPATVNITVRPVNDRPVFGDPGPIAVDEGEQLTVPVPAIDPDGTSSTVQVESGPVGLVYTAGEVRWRPDEEDGPGTYPVTLRAEDGDGGTARVTFLVTVTEINQPPVIKLSDSADAVQYSDPLPTVTVTVSDKDLPRQAVASSIAGLPSGLSASEFAYDNALDAWVAKITGRAKGPAGTFPVTVSVGDGAGGTDTATL